MTFFQTVVVVFIITVFLWGYIIVRQLNQIQSSLDGIQSDEEGQN